jgi:hypothetical protein
MNRTFKTDMFYISFAPFTELEGGKWFASDDQRGD